MSDAAAEFVVFIGAMLLFLFVLVGGIFLVSRQVSHHIDHTNCVAYAQRTGRETRFVDYSFFKWDCLTPSQDGKWLPTDQLRELTSD